MKLSTGEIKYWNEMKKLEIHFPVNRLLSADLTGFLIRSNVIPITCCTALYSSW